MDEHAMVQWADVCIICTLEEEADLGRNVAKSNA
jgi:hypothetical protein